MAATTSTVASSTGTSLSVGRVGHQLADARVVEERLDDDETADQPADLRADDGDRRRHGVAQGVDVDDAAPGQALERRGAHVRRVERVDHAGARHAGDVAQLDEHQRDGRQDQVVEARERPGAGRRRGRVREDLDERRRTARSARRRSRTRAPP